MIDEKFIEQLKSKNDIVEVVSAYCSLERRGGSYWARCPLPGHMEKTPSFSVNAAGQFFYCFGCSRGGDVIKFIMEMENLNYIEAVRFLCARVNMKMPDEDPSDERERGEKARKKERLLSLLKNTARFYFDNLRSERGKEYLDYFRKRGFSDEIIIHFGLGCSTDYRSLVTFLKNKGYTYEEMLDAGVVSYNEERGYSDFEAKRAVIPIIDAMGSVVAFVGRVLTPKADFMKYKNTSDTSIFRKNRCLFNANNLKKLKRETGSIPYVVMVEGQIDVISVYASGIKNVAASMGTSLTAEQARLILRYTDTVIVSYDGDAAGQKATFRGLGIFRDAGLSVKVATLPDGMDPDEFIKAKGVEAYKKLLDEAVPLIDYKLAVVRKAFDENTIDGRRKIVDNSLKVIAESDKDFEREELLKKLSEYTKLTYESLKRDLDNNTRESLKQVDRSVGTREKREDEGSAVVKAERFFLYSAIFSKEYFSERDFGEIEFSAARIDIADRVSDMILSGEKIVPATMSDRLGEEYLVELNAIYAVGDSIPENTARAYYCDCLKFLKRDKIEGEIEDLKEVLAAENDLEIRRSITEKIQKKLIQLKKLKTEDKK